MRRRTLHKDGEVLLDVDLTYEPGSKLVCTDGTEFVYNEELGFYVSDVMLYPSKIILYVPEFSLGNSALFNGVFVNDENNIVNEYDYVHECWTKGESDGRFGIGFRISGKRNPYGLSTFAIRDMKKPIIFENGQVKNDGKVLYCSVSNEYAYYDGAIQICNIGGRKFGTNLKKLKHITLYK